MASCSLADHALAHFVAQRGRRRFFQQFLMPPLNAAFALAENLHVAVLIGQHLKFDVARRADVFFEINVGARKCRARFLLRLRQQVRAIPRPN